MNKVISFVGLWVLIFAMSCAISKKENERVEQLLDTSSKPVQLTSADSLTKERLKGFEGRAEQKLDDFYDYLTFLSGGNYDDAMKDEIRFSALGLFYDPKASVCPVEIKGVNDSFPVESFLADSVVNTLPKNLSISSFEIIRPLEFVTEAYYHGQLAFELKVGKEDEGRVLSKKADFSLRKINKKLGKESVKTWEVFLESIL